MIEVKLGDINSLVQLYEESRLVHHRIPKRQLNEYLFKVNENQYLRKDLQHIVENQIKTINNLKTLLTIHPSEGDFIENIRFKSIFVDGVGNVEFI